MKNLLPKTTQGNPKYFKMLLGTLVLGASPPLAHAVILVDAGTADLTTKLNKATAADYTFELLGNVGMTTTFNMDGTTRKNIVIDGTYGDDNRAIINRSGSNSHFYVNTAGNSLTIRNAEIKQSSGTGGPGAIYITAANSTLNLDNTTFTGNTAADALGYGGAISALNNTKTTVNGNVSFINNKGTGQAGGAVGVYGASASTRSTLTFTGETLFEGNSTTYYGGALAVNYFANVTFEEEATFKNNSVTGGFVYGGAIDLYGGDSHVTFKKNALFEGNYVKSTSSLYGARGGAINIGFVTGTDRPQLVFEETATFKNNYAWGTSTNKAYGGALSIMSGEVNPDTTNPPSGRYYEVQIGTGVFDNNIAYSETGNAYGGAIYAKTVNNVLTLGSGSSFTNNYATTQGGAIYFDQGILNLNGNVTFEGNRHGAKFNTSTGRPVYVAGSGTANAIYFGVSSNTATLNMNTGAGERIQFHDPITAAPGKTVTVNKTGAGEAVFYGYDSNFLNKTTVSGGTFRLTDGASYGLLGTSTNSTFTVNSGATLHGGAGSTLRTSQLQVNGTMRIDAGTFTVTTNNTVTFGADSVLLITILDTDSYSQLVFDTPASLLLDGTSLEINASGYIPSSDISDSFTIVTGISGTLNGKFAQGDLITINGADFEIHYNTGNIVLQQISTSVIPEPATYAALFGIALLAYVVLRRRMA